MKKAWVFSYALSAQQRLWSGWADAQTDLSLRWAHSHFVGCVMSWLIIKQNQQSDCAPSEDSDQSGHPPSLIRVFAVHMKKAWVFSFPLGAQQRLWPDWADAQADLSLRWAHSHFVGFVMSRLIWRFIPVLFLYFFCVRPADFKIIIIYRVAYFYHYRNKMRE